jgi:hypothetical protein
MIIIKDKKLSDFDELIHHGFFGRQGGVSEGIYNSLNCGVGSNDNPDAVMENRARVAHALSGKAENLITVHQTHSADCLIVHEPLGIDIERPKADALATDKAGLILGVLTADCGCILFTGQKADGSPVIGAAHAGWKGALGGVLESTVQQMMTSGAEKKSLHASIGPCIGPKSYEVSEGFEAPFLERDPADEHFFKTGQKEGHLMFDLPGYIANRLAQAGVSQVTITGHDTFAEEENFFSYRRTTHRGEPDYGRQISAIMILD